MKSVVLQSDFTVLSAVYAAYANVFETERMCKLVVRYALCWGEGVDLFACLRVNLTAQANVELTM